MGMVSINIIRHALLSAVAAGPEMLLLLSSDILLCPLLHLATHTVVLSQPQPVLPKYRTLNTPLAPTISMQTRF